MQSSIDDADRARRLGNVAALLIELARRGRTAETKEVGVLPSDDRAIEGENVEPGNDQ